jgi:hypothetical protein
MEKIRGRAHRLRGIVHIGPIKSGTTAFTAQLTASQKLGLLGKNIIYALPREIKLHNVSKTVTPEQIGNLAPELHWNRQSGKTSARNREPKTILSDGARAYLDDLVNDLRAHMTSDITVIFVQENLSRRSGPGQLTSELLARFDSVDYVFVARAQQFIVPSAISQRVKKASYPRVWDAQVSHYLHNLNLANQFDYPGILERWAPVDTRVRLFVVPFLESDRGTRKLFYRILTTLGLTANLGTAIEDGINATPTRFEIAALGRYKRFTVRKTPNGLPLGRRQRRRRLDAYNSTGIVFKQIARLINSPRWEIHPEEAKNIVDFYQPSNIRFREKLGTQAQSAEWIEWFRDAGVRDS